MRPLELRCVRFNQLSFGEEVAKASCASSEATQVSYLAGYLGRHGLGIQTMLVESPYVDRHYIEEYSRYYATAFRPPPSSTVRIHFFTDEFADEQLRGWLVMAAGGEEPRLEFQARLQASYSGYVVVRPLPSAPIGRSILAVYSDKESRCFTNQPHRAHLLGLELTIEGVPFQQQEVAVGACATTAMWSALTIASRATGRRGPTPYQVTEAATRHVLNDRQIPADSGLDLQQILAAVRDFGFSPLTLKAADNFEAFTHSLVLVLIEDGGYHAVTAQPARRRVSTWRGDDPHDGADSGLHPRRSARALRAYALGGPGTTDY